MTFYAPAHEAVSSTQLKVFLCSQMQVLKIDTYPPVFFGQTSRLDYEFLKKNKEYSTQAVSSAPQNTKKETSWLTFEIHGKYNAGKTVASKNLFLPQQKLWVVFAKIKRNY